MNEFILIQIQLYLKKQCRANFGPHIAGPVCIAHPVHPIAMPLVQGMTVGYTRSGMVWGLKGQRLRLQGQ